MRDQPYKILIIAGSGSGTTNTFLKQIKQQHDDNHSIIDKIYLYAKDLNEAKISTSLQKT